MEEKEKEERIKITFILPISLNSKDEVKISFSDLDRVQTFLLHSIRKFVDKDFLHKILIITPPNDFEKITSILKPFSVYLPIEFISDNDICPEISKYEGFSWFKQQIIKLKIAEKIETDFYLTLDSDMLFTRPIKQKDLFVKGKPRINLHLGSEHVEWWANTSEFIGYDFSKYKVEEFEPSFTPVIMYTSLVKDLILKLQTISGNKWVEFLMDPIVDIKAILWTEYCLYYLYIHFEKGGIRNFYYYNEDNNLFNFFVGPSVWRDEDFSIINEEYIKEIFNNERFHFISVIQSTLSFSLSQIVEKFNLFFRL